MNKVVLNPDDVWFDLLNDIMFKIVFATEGNEPLLCHLLNALLHYEGDNTIVELKILNPFLTPGYPVDKLSILDIKATDLSGKRYSIEVQKAEHAGLAQRMLYYLFQNFNMQFKRGKSYADIKKTIGLWILNTSFNQKTRAYRKFSFLDNETYEPFEDLTELHLVELVNYKKDLFTATTSFERWLDVFKNSSKIRTLDDLPKEYLEEKGIKEAVKGMLEANVNQQYREIMFSYEMAENDHASQLIDKERKGVEKGIVQGEDKKARAIAKNLLSINLSIEDIVKVTGLTQEQILGL
jgi:predicted transposase/invertase (TIGR01784 family)